MRVRVRSGFCSARARARAATLAARARGTYWNRVDQKNRGLEQKAAPQVRVLPQGVRHLNLVTTCVPHFVAGEDEEVVVDLELVHKKERKCAHGTL